MKLFYTRKELDEAIAKALIERDMRRSTEEQIERLHGEIYRLEERISRLEYQGINKQAENCADSVATMRSSYRD